ncbi:glycerate kinase [Paenibacillus alginolyticus]|uniref:glycerate kinase family protein n=1 Tax=Paenibacillus alginolyticus TaxID=59839 RepID=UPI0004057560|nr:glycerate kinase [Paenibacillus alginolyticus]MCY9669229.1 glycerate kinase [Paenibacillus alginolyticus]
MKYLIAPDSYKGSLSALQVTKAMERGIKRVDQSAEVRLLPMADGGEGTVEALIEVMKGQIIPESVIGPLGKPVPSFYGFIPEHKTAIIEMAAASGLTLVPKEELNPLITTSYGTGQLIKSALDRGCNRIIIGIGGSATNDGGVGMAQALGYCFLDQQGKELPFGGDALTQLMKIDISGRDPRIDEAEIIVACDVVTLLCGEKGASAVFGPQKGASPEMIAHLDQGLEHMAHQVKETLGISLLDVAGGGAAGGLGAGLVAFAGAKLLSGIEMIMELCSFDRLAEDVDLVITGEGNTDFQTAMGKTPVGVAKRAKQFQLPVICLSGGLGQGYKEVYKHGIDAVFSIMPRPAKLEEAFEHGEQWIEDSLEAIIRLWVGQIPLQAPNK